MAITTPETAAAATQQTDMLGRPFMLIGIFDGPDGTRVLVRRATGAIDTVTDQPTSDGLRLHSVGDGWAMIEDRETFHRLTL